MQYHLTKKSLIALASAGGALEMYDFVIYIFFATTIEQLFFPLQSAYAGMLLTFAVFGSGYLFRPLGGIIFGYIGDRYGRRTGLLTAIILMAIAILAMGLMPTYGQIGIIAPLLFCFFRLIQGIALGGDLPGAITFINEYVNNNERGFMTGLLFFAINIGILLASLVGTLCMNLLTHAQLIAWGWRVAFLLGISLFIVGYYFRSKNIETPLFQHLVQKSQPLQNPLFHLFRYHFLNIIRAILMMALHGVVVVLIFLYMPIYLHTTMQLPLPMATLINTINILVFSLLIPIVGILSDHFGRKKILMIACILFIAFAYPLYELISAHVLFYLYAGLLCLAIMSAFVVGVVPVTLAELFSTKIRYSGIGISYNLGFGLFGGLAPIVSTILIHHFKLAVMPSFIFIVIALVLLLLLIPMRFEKNAPLS